MTRIRRIVAWLLFVVVVLLLLGSAVAAELLEDRIPTDTAGFDGGLGYLWLASWLGFPLVGAVIASRRRTVIGWLLLLMGVCIATAVATSGFLLYQIHVTGRPPNPLLLAAVSASGAPAFGLAPFAIDRFPSDEAPAGRWRYVLRAAAAVLAIVVTALAVRPTIHDERGVAYDNAFAIEVLGSSPDTVIAVGGVALAVFFVAVVVRTIVRFRRATGVARAQLKWFVSSLCVFPALFAVVLLGGDRMPSAVLDGLVAVTFFVSLNGMAAAIGIAILRYRLFEIDRVVSRTVTYLTISAILLAVYLGGILLSQAVIGPIAGSSDLGVALSTLVAAALFQPVRGRVQRFVDRRFNRARYDAAQTSERFAARLRGQVDMAELRRDLRTTVQQTVHPTAVSVWLAPGRGNGSGTLREYT